MGSMKEHMMDLQEARFLAWAAEHYPDVSADTPEWEQIGNYYSWEQEAQFYEEMLLARYEEDLRDRASLENIELRFQHAMSELDELGQLNAVPQPELICRMGIVHSVSVMGAFLMYCARALLNHDWPLRRFREEYFLRFASKQDKKIPHLHDLSLFRESARRYVAKSSFQSAGFIKRYFTTVMHFPCDWPLVPLMQISELHNSLVHRAGYTQTGSRVDVSPVELSRAISVVRTIIETAMASLRLEQEFFRNGSYGEEKEFVRSILGKETPTGSHS